MNTKLIIALLFVLSRAAATLAGPQMIAFERNDAVWIANLDGTDEKKVADGIFPAISPEGTRVAFNTVERKSESSVVRQMAVVDVVTGKMTVFKDVPSENSYYPSWTTNGQQILFTTRPKEVWDLVVINADGANFHVVKPGEPNVVTRYSPVWARDGQSVFCEDMANIYQLGLDGAIRAQWKINKIIPKGDMSGDGRIDVSPDGKRLLLSIDLAEESGRKDWDGPLPALWSFDLQSQKATRLTPKKLFGWDGVWIDDNNILFLSKAASEKEDSIYRMSTDGKNLKRLIKNARFPSVSAPST
jgi:TolB protein